MNEESKKALLQAVGSAATTVSSALSKSNGEKVVLTIGEAANILAMTGQVATAILTLSEKQPSETTESGVTAVKSATPVASATAADEQAEGMVEDLYKPVPEVFHPEDDLPLEGTNKPTPDAMRRAIRAASEVNAAVAPRPEPSAELITGTTGNKPATTRPISASNLLRNAELAERARQMLHETPGATPTPTFRVRPAGAIAAAAVQPAEKAIVPRPAVQPANMVRLTPNEQLQSDAAVIMDADTTATESIELPQPVHQEYLPDERLSDDVVKSSSRPLIVRPNGYVPAIGLQRDLKSTAVRLRRLFATIPETEMLAGATARDKMPILPGTKNMRVASPYERLTNAKDSEFAKIFAPSAFTPDCHGVVTVDTPGYVWRKSVDLESMSAADLVCQHQGFYGYNQNNHGPAYVFLRLPRCIVVWNFNHTQDNCRIFYIGRSNITGYWYPPEAMDRDELLRVAFELSLHGQKEQALANGETFVPPAILT